MRNESDLSRDAAFTNEVIAFADAELHAAGSGSGYADMWRDKQMYCNKATDVNCDDVLEPCRWMFCNDAMVESPKTRDNIFSIGAIPQ